MNQLKSDLLIVIPEKYQSMIFHQYHNNILTSHQGAWKTFITMKKNIYFPGMLNKLKQYITACDICQRTQRKRNNNAPDACKNTRNLLSNDTIISRYKIHAKRL